MDRVILFALALAVLTWTVPAEATHNSIGAHAGIVEPQAVDEEGNLASQGSDELAYLFHEDAARDGLIPQPRAPPQDQRGDRYTDCTHADSFRDKTRYEEYLVEGDACYVGYFEVFRMWRATWALYTLAQPSDPLYALNPTPADPYCRGREETEEHTGISPLDAMITNAERVEDERCQGDAHESYHVGGILLDTNLLEPRRVSEAIKVEDGHGTRTVPLITQPYALLFGQPHPENPNPSDLKVGKGPFHEAPGEPERGLSSVGAVLGDLSNACGERTQDCVLLTPRDLALYDEAEDGRLCEFAPQLVPATPTASATGCGVFGSAFHTFIAGANGGGFGITDGPPSWVSTLPGWYRGVATVSTPSTYTMATFVDSFTMDEGEYSDAFHYYYAVNPEVPDVDHPLWCVRPSMLATGTGAGELTKEEDPGFYGAYRADALAYNQHPVLYRSFLDASHEATHEPVREVLSPIQESVKDAARSLEGSAIPKPHNALGATQKDFFVDLPYGLACDPTGHPAITKEDRYEGGLVFDTRIRAETVGCIEDVCEPKRQAQPMDAFTFQGTVQGVVDTGRNGSLDACPQEDACVWQPYWDAYNEDCLTYLTEPCRTYLERVGYDVDAGVGLLFALEVTGPVLLTDTTPDPDTAPTRTGLVGSGNRTTATCILGVSQGFLEPLERSFEQDRWWDIAGRDDVCPGFDGTPGSLALVGDAFEPQPPEGAGTFESALTWAPLDVNATFDLCVGGYWSVDAEVTEDTRGTLEHGSSVTYGECVDMDGQEAAPWELGLGSH